MALLESYDSQQFVRVFLGYLKYIQKNEYTTVIRLKSTTENALVKKVMNHFHRHFSSYSLKAQLRLLWFVKVLGTIDKQLKDQMHHTF